MLRPCADVPEPNFLDQTPSPVVLSNIIYLIYLSLPEWMRILT